MQLFHESQYPTFIMVESGEIIPMALVDELSLKPFADMDGVYSILSQELKGEISSYWWIKTVDDNQVRVYAFRVGDQPDKPPLYNLTYSSSILELLYREAWVFYKTKRK